MKKLLPFLLAFLLFVPGTVYAQSVYDAFIIAGADDYRHRINIALHEFVVGLGVNDSGDSSATLFDYTSGLRFQNVTIPQGSTIETAFLQLRAHSLIGSLPVPTRIQGEAADDSPVTFNDVDYHTRVRTSWSIPWNITVWTSPTVYSSPDITNVIQEIIDRPLWVSGNDLQLFWEDNGGVGFQSSHLARAEAWEDAGVLPPRLIVTYSGPLPLTVETAIQGWISFIGNGLAILMVAIVCGIFLWLVKAPPLMLLICGWLSLLLLFKLGIVSAAIVLIALVGFVGALFFKIILGSSESA